MNRVLILRLRVEPSSDDARTAEQLADDITEQVIDSLPGDGIAIATVVQEAVKG